MIATRSNTPVLIRRRTKSSSRASCRHHAGNGVSDLEVDDIRKLAEARGQNRHRPGIDREFADAAHDMPVNDPGYRIGDEDIAAPSRSPGTRRQFAS